ncbi:MAG TPA: RDD family protein [Dehalococcoidia bacterium]|nr:RDD family protein [Dehalococcoidia bacterium]
MTTAAEGRTRERRRRRDIVTPEGVALPIELAELGERAAAFLIDLLILGACVVFPSLLLVLLAMLAGIPYSNGVLMALVLLLSFAVRSFYFIYFELHWHGTTPGKRALKIRVIDRAGGRLRPDAVFARNLMREVEFFIPVSLLFVAGEMDRETLITILGASWTLVLALVPFFNRDRMRPGDLVGGTWVVTAPKGVLLPDMAAAKGGERRKASAAAPDYPFTKKQLDTYGIYELQTLESVLRQSGPRAKAMQEAVRDRIQKKIRWTRAAGETDDARRFLEAFYAALRSHLETKMLLGVRREDKHDKR